jgi:hypothetical protein
LVSHVKGRAQTEGVSDQGAEENRDEVIRECRKLHNRELHNLYSSPDIINQIKSRRMRWARHVARMGVERKVYKVMVGKPERKQPPGRPRRRWEDVIRMDLSEIGWGVECIHLAQDRDLRGLL